MPSCVFFSRSSTSPTTPTRSVLFTGTKPSTRSLNPRFAPSGAERTRPPTSRSTSCFVEDRELLEARFPNEVARLRDAGLILRDADYDDLETSYPTEDDERDRRNGTYDEKALLCFFMELFDAQHQNDATTHWTEGEYEVLKESIDSSWVGEDGDPNERFTCMTRRGLEIVEKAFPEAFERLREHDMMYEPGVYGDFV